MGTVRGENGAGLCPAPRQGTCPLHPDENEAVEIVQTMAAQILAPQKWIAILWARILVPEAQSDFRFSGKYRYPNRRAPQRASPRTDRTLSPNHRKRNCGFNQDSE